MARYWRGGRAGRISLREKMLSNLASFKAQATPTDENRARYDAFVARTEAAIPPAPKARKLRRPVDGKPVVPLESEVQRAIMDALRLHPRVIKVIRLNSGGAYFRDAHGKEAFVKFSSEPVVDLHVMLRNPPRIGWLEVKRPGFKGPSDAREERQAEFLQAVREAGGIAAFVTSWDEVEELLR